MENACLLVFRVNGRFKQWHTELDLDTHNQDLYGSDEYNGIQQTNASTILKGGMYFFHK